MPERKTTAIPRTAQVRRAAVFLGNEPRRTETRFCPRRNGDSSSASKSSSRASSSSSRTGSSGCRYNSSCEMVGVFLAINPGQLSSGNRERNHYQLVSRIEMQKFADLLHWKEEVAPRRIKPRTD